MKETNHKVSIFWLGSLKEVKKKLEVRVLGMHKNFKN